jgi:hypothetical protein
MFCTDTKLYASEQSGLQERPRIVFGRPLARILARTPTVPRIFVLLLTSLMHRSFPEPFRHSPAIQPIDAMSSSTIKVSQNAQQIKLIT